MADVTLKDGREIDIDLSKISIAEYRSLFDPEKKADDGDGIIAKVTGLTEQEIGSLSYTDYKKLAKVFFKKAAEPDPS
jgi:hypothetical protein